MNGSAKIIGQLERGDIEITLPRAAACAVVATAAAVVCDGGFNCTRLTERSTGHLRGELDGGGTAVELSAPQGQIFIQMD